MVSAPTPGVGRRAEQAEAAKAVAIITVRGETKRLAIGNVPLKEKLLVRQATGLPFDAFVTENQIGEDSLIVLWWLARRAEGELQLTFDRAASEWPEDLGVDDVSMDIETPDADDPEV